MHIETLAIPGVKVLTPRIFADERGYFCETWNAASFARQGLPDSFVQDNHACSKAAGTLRGLHFQKPPFAQGKLVRVVRGAVIDVAVDLRTGSPAYGRWVSALLSADNKKQIWVPAGFAHGYVTLEPDTEAIYKVTHPYAAASEGGIIWNDPALAIDWHLNGKLPTLSDKDKLWPTLALADHGF